MTEPSEKTELDGRLGSAEEELDRLMSYLEDLIYTIDLIDSGQLVNFAVWVRRKEGPMGLEIMGRKRWLMEEFQRIRQKILDLKKERAAIEYRLRVIRAHETREGLRREMQDILKRAEKGKKLSDEDTRKLVRKAEQALDVFVGLLQDNPTKENVRGVLDCLTDIQIFTDDSKKAEQGFRVVRRATTKMRNRAERAFRRRPTVQGFKSFLKSDTLFQFFNDAILDDPAGFVPARTTHVVARGDTLSSISRKYYKQPGYWDVIFWANTHVIRNRLTNLPVGKRLEIP